MKAGVSLLKMILNIGLLFGTMNLFITEISATEMLPRKDDLLIREDITPLGYDVKLSMGEPPYMHLRCNIYFYGECDIEIQIDEPVDQITLHEDRQHVYILDPAIEHISGTSIPVVNVKHTEERNIMRIYLDRNISGHYILKLTYGTCLRDEDIINITSTTFIGSIISLFATHLRPLRTKALFPCLDVLHIKVPFNITITMNKQYDALSNAYGQNYRYNERLENMKILPFEQTTPISTYDIAIVIYHSDFLRRRSVTTEMYYRNKLHVARDIQFADNIQDNIIDYLPLIWESFRNLSRARYIAIPGFPQNAMMKHRLCIFREESVLYNASVHPYPNKIEAARLIARVVAHERLNNVVKPDWWNDLWINEAIAMLIGQDAINKNFPDLRLWDLFVVQYHQESLRLDARETFMGPVQKVVTNSMDIHTLFTFSHYIKAPVIMHMLRRVLSDDVFNLGIDRYLKSST